jgi:hypothetical protein
MIVIGFQRASCWQLAWLKCGFRHCFAYRAVGDSWIACDPLSHGIELQLAGHTRTRGLLACLAAVGSTAVACRPTVLLRPLPWLRPFTCVEFCKRLVRCARTDVITPYQLFCELMRVGGRA